MCYKELDKRFAVVHGKKNHETARIEATVLNSLVPISKADICGILRRKKRGVYMKAIQLRPYQIKAIDAIQEAIARGQKNRFG